MRIINFWTQEYDRMAEEYKQKFSAEAKELIELADGICENIFLFKGHWEMERTHEPVAFDQGIRWDYYPFDDREWTFAFNRHSFGVTLAKAWCLTKREKYPQAFKRLLKDWIRNVPFTEESKVTTWRAIETGLRCENWLRAISIFGTEVTADEDFMEKICQSLKTHARWLMEADKAFQRLSNWGILQNHGLFLLGLVFEQSEWCETAVGRLQEEIHTQVMKDGTHWEQSPLYHCEVLHCLLDTVLAAKKMNYPLEEHFLMKIRGMSHALAFLLRPDGKLICQSDSDEVDARDLLVLAAVLFNDPLLKGYSGSSYLAENFWDVYEQRAVYEKLTDAPHRGSIALEDSGNYMLWDRECQGESFLHMHCGSLGSGHGHADLLHIDLYSRGGMVLTDSGRYTYVDSEIRKTLKSPSAHNTVTVDETDFTVYQSAWGYGPIAEPIKGEFRFTPKADYISGMHLGYLKEGVVVRRRILRIEKDVFVVWDNCYVSDDSKEHFYQRFFHFEDYGVAEVSGNTVYYQGGNCRAVMKLPKAESECTVVQRPLSKVYNELQGHDCVIEKIRAKGDVSLPMVIAVGDRDSKEVLDVSVEPVMLLGAQTRIMESQAQALKIKYGDREWVLILVHKEVISEVDLFTSCGYSGYGKTLLFSAEYAEGLCLSW